MHIYSSMGLFEEGVTLALTVRLCVCWCCIHLLLLLLLFLLLLLLLLFLLLLLLLQLSKVDLARHIINHPMISRDKQLEKKLWLRIAEHVIKKELDIKR